MALTPRPHMSGRATTGERPWLALARWRRHFRRGQGRHHARHDETHPWMPQVWLLPASTYGSDVHSGRQRGRGETPATTSPHCPTQAWYELHGVTVKPIEKKGRKREPLSTPDTVSLISGEVESWWRRQIWQCALTFG
jgi:hypothetical protein